MSSSEILILYNNSTGRLREEVFEKLFCLLPAGKQGKILRLRKWQDRQRSVIGHALLLQGLQALGLHTLSLHDLQYNHFERPFFEGGLDFNISHSGSYVICAISKTGKLGIDVEEIKDIPVSDFKEEFSAKELLEITEAKDRLHCFYSYWTKKEAFLKAIGIGLNVPLSKVSIKANTIEWENHLWYLQEIPLANMYVSFLCTDIVLPEIVIKKVVFD